MCLPAAIYRRWEVSVAASKCAEWPQWFQNLDHTRQKAHVESLAKGTKETFWTRLSLEYEEDTRPRQTRLVAAAARALVMLDPSSAAWKDGRAGMKHWYARYPQPPEPKTYEGYELDYGLEGYIEPRSAFLTAHDSISLDSYSRLPRNAFQFAEQIFRGKSHEEGVAEHKANLARWTREIQVRRVEGQPDCAVWGNIVEFVLEEESPADGKA